MRAAIFSLGLLLHSSLSLAQTPPTPTTRVATPTPTPAVAAAAPSGHGMTPFVRALSQGFQAYGRRDYNAAIQSFQEAEGIDRQSAWPRLYIGYAQIARGDAATALSSFRDAQRRATVAGDDGARARAMAAVALLLEGQTHWDEARIGWQDYATFCDGHAQAGFAATGRGRVQAIQERATLAEQYQAVRQRIAERQRINAAGPTAAPTARP